MTRPLLAIACGALGVGACSCESTERESAKIAGEGTQLLSSQRALRVGAVNRGVHVSGVTLLNDAGRTAVAVGLTGTASHPQANVPVLVEVTAKSGKLLYSNNTGGLEYSLQHMPLLRPGQDEWWVDDQVLTASNATDRDSLGVHVRVGQGSELHTHTRPIPEISASAVHLDEQSGIGVLSGELINRSAHIEHKVPVFAVALRNGRVTAAGRAVVAALPGNSTARTSFQIFLVGDPTGSSIQLTVDPTAA
jgi:hypothetical protein